MSEPQRAFVDGVMAMWRQKMNTADIAKNWRCSEAVIYRALHIGLERQLRLKETG